MWKAPVAHSSPEMHRKVGKSGEYNTKMLLLSLKKNWKQIRLILQTIAENRRTVRMLKDCGQKRRRLQKENCRNGSIKPYTPAGEIPEKKKLVEPNVQNRKNGYSLLKKRQVLQIWKRKQKKWCPLKRKRQKHIPIGSRCSHSQQKILGKRSGCTLRGKIPQKSQ